MTLPALLADAAFLVSFYKPLLVFITFVPWAWLVSSKLDKDAQMFKLPRQQWNAVHMACGVAALAAMMFIPIFWIGWPVGIIVLITPVLIYVKVRNQAVPEGQEFKLTGEGVSARLTKARQARAEKAAAVTFTAHGKEIPVPTKEDPTHAVHLSVEDIIVPALEARASHVEVAVGSGGGVVAQTVDGIRYKRDPMPTEELVSAIDYLKNIAGMNVEDRRRRQAVNMKMSGPLGVTQLSIVTEGSSSGQKMRIVFDQKKQVVRAVDGIGLLDSQLEQVRSFEAEHIRHGVFLFGAPPAQGLTTTGYALLDGHDAYTSNIKTLEWEVQAEIDGIDHLQFDPTNPDVDYPTALQSILRRDPDIVLIAELRDAETARIAADPGVEGPLIYVPQRSATISDQIREWVKLVGDVKDAIKTLSVVMNQRLLRQVCPNCRQAYQPSAQQLQAMKLPADKISQLYQPSGKVQVKNKIETCNICQGTGYFGQIGVFQVLVINDEIRRLLLEGNLKAALAEARRNKMVYLQEAALRKVVEGTTTLEEVARVTTPPKKKSSSSRSPQRNPAPAT